MIAEPALTPVATPESEPIVATDVLLLVQLPPAGVAFKEVVKPEQTLNVPVIAVGV